MEREDVYKLFALLETLYRGKVLQKDRGTVAAWDAVLKPWSYAQVRDAAIRRARDNRYLPDPSELAEYLPEVQGDDRGYIPGMAEMASMDKARAAWEDYRRRLHDAGLPAFAEAKAQGMTAEEWDKMAGHIDFYPVVKGGAI